MIEVKLSVTINGRTIALSDGYDAPPAEWADNDREAATALGFQLLEQMCSALDTEFECPATVAEAPTNAEPAAAVSAGLPDGWPNMTINAEGLAAAIQNVQRAMSAKRLNPDLFRAGPPPDLMVATDLTDDAFNNPDHIVVAQDVDEDPAAHSTLIPGTDAYEDPDEGLTAFASPGTVADDPDEDRYTEPYTGTDPADQG